jgi:hypothetical protein
LLQNGATSNYTSGTGSQRSWHIPRSAAAPAVN